ncbi:MAG TPA: hypothetical protein VMH35_07610 [Streptosporangiaceae bacterium]|nr:hypothetical protein [Streptosporangiaceae bacterium]
MRDLDVLADFDQALAATGRARPRHAPRGGPDGTVDRMATDSAHRAVSIERKRPAGSA